MMQDRPRYYVVKRGRGYWQPTAPMRALGFYSVPCGPDGPEAHAIAQQWNAKWEVAREGHAASDAAITAAGFALEQADEARAHAILGHMEAWAEPFINSSAAAYLAKGMRRLARDLEQAAQRCGALAA